jgi:uncharacterized small protein (DUF1192 family)
MSETQETALAILRESLQSCLAIRDGLSYWAEIVDKEGSEIPSYHGGHALALELRKVLRNYQFRFSQQIAIIAPDAPAVDEEAARLRVAPDPIVKEVVLDDPRVPELEARNAALEDELAIAKALLTEKLDEVATEDPRVAVLQAEIERLHAEALNPTPRALEDLVAPGTMIVEDEVKLRRALLASEIEDYANVRISSRYDSNTQREILQFIGDYHNKRKDGLKPSQKEVEAFARANEQHAWMLATEAFARNLKMSLSMINAEILRAYDIENAGWPQ